MLQWLVQQDFDLSTVEFRVVRRDGFYKVRLSPIVLTELCNFNLHVFAKTTLVDPVPLCCIAGDQLRNIFAAAGSSGVIVIGDMN